MFQGFLHLAYLMIIGLASDLSNAEKLRAQQRAPAQAYILPQPQAPSGLYELRQKVVPASNSVPPRDENRQIIFPPSPDYDYYDDVDDYDEDYYKGADEYDDHYVPFGLTSYPPSNDPPQSPAPSEAPPPPPLMPYQFSWSVEDDENSYSMEESQDGSLMQGYYRVLLPDGRVQTVTYFDDGSGYVAEVTYE